MGTFKNQKDKVMGSAKEKIGEILNKEELVNEGRGQAEFAKENEERQKARIKELEDQQAEKEANQQDLTKERRTEDSSHRKTPLPESDHIPEQQKIDEQRMKHYTGIEEKL
ncbi:MAG: CsbD family protein [Enterococcus lacertideformus]|uniref:CsbD family protein n=1 Tax=Enterococcus lacertideformus TaxID=2771493 RepID=A0A931AVM6_9ENTE|nr:CsbD family protein [Enterococcus lacertideformus]